MDEKIITREQIVDFKKYLYEDERSKNTVEKYLRDIRHFLKSIGQKSLQKADVLEYKRRLCETYASRSVNSMLSALNAFFAFAKWHDLKVKTLKIQKQIFADKSRELSKAEYKRLLTAAQSKRNAKLYYLIQTIASTGLRVSEIRYVTCDAVRQGQAVINCKGKIRRVFLPKKLCAMLKKHIKAQGIKNGAVFVSKSGKPLDRFSVWKMLKALCGSAGVDKEKVFPHNLRHLFARTYYSLNKDIIRLADILGHSNINTTRIYTVESGDEHIRQLQRLGLLMC